MHPYSVNHIDTVPLIEKSSSPIASVPRMENLKEIINKYLLR